MQEKDILEKSEALIITKGEKGSSILLKSGQIDVPVVPEERVADPTGVGDAYRGGLMKGLAAGADWEICGRLGSVAATYSLEHLGATTHTYTWKDFKARYEKALRHPVARERLALNSQMEWGLCSVRSRGASPDWRRCGPRWSWPRRLAWRRCRMR